MRFAPQGHLLKGGESLSRWDKPSIVVMSESNYSDAFMFPYVYKQNKLPWKNRNEVREYFGKKEKKTHGLEDVHAVERHAAGACAIEHAPDQFGTHNRKLH